MTLVLNTRLWREARQTGLHTGVDLFALAQIQRHTLTYVSRLWVENHGERVAGMVSAVLRRPIKVDDLFPHWDRPDERPLSSWESALLRRAVEARSQALSPREIGVVRLTFGLEGQPLSLAQVAASMGVTRERVRQIEAVALGKLDVVLPRGLHKSTVARRRRARLLLKALHGEGRERRLRIRLSPGRQGPMGTVSKTRAGAVAYGVAG